MIKDFFLNQGVFDLSDFTPEEIQTDDIKILQAARAFNTAVYRDTISLQDIIETLDPKYGNVKITNEKSDNELWMFGDCENPDFGRKMENITYKGKFFMVDYDKDYTIEQFEEDYKDYFYLLYTSFSHTDEHHKFRVIMYGNYDKPLDIYQQRAILEHSFRNADSTTLQPNRMFYLPAHKEGAPYVYKQHMGKQFPLWFKDIERYCNKRKLDEAKVQQQKKVFYDFHNKNNDRICAQWPDVQHYLLTPYLKITGNGDSDSSLFKALRLCIKYNDQATLQDVILKAKSEHWTDEQINRKIKTIKENYLK